MKGFKSIYSKELYSMFASPIFYVLGVTFLILSGYFFYSAVAYFNIMSMQAAQNPYMARQLNLVEMVLRPFFMDVGIILLLISPLITMRLYAEERKTGTLELLFTYPVSDRACLLGKFAAVVTALAILLAGTLPGMLTLVYVGNPGWKPIVSGYLGVVLLGGSFMALGIFTSSLTQNQIIAAVLSFGALLFLWVIGWLKSLMGPPVADLVEYISITRHLDSFSKGVLDSRDLLYYAMFILFFLFLSLRQVESNRWRG